jgi:hypothetical protein
MLNSTFKIGLRIVLFVLVLGLLVFLTLHVPYVWNNFFELLDGSLITFHDWFKLCISGGYVLLIGILVPLIDAVAIATIILGIIYWVLLKDFIKSISDEISEAFNE